MSYRTIKRILGETRLERKFLFLFAVLFFTLIISSFGLYSFRTEDVVYKLNTLKGRLLANQVLYSVHWEKLEQNQQWLPVIEELTDKFSQEEYPWTFDFLLPNQSTGDGRLIEPYEQELLNRFEYSQAAKKAAMATNENEVAPQDRGQMPELPQVENEFAERLSSDRKWYFYYQPIRAQEGCLPCHLAPLGGASPLTGDMAAGATVARSTASRSGQLLAVIKVTISNEPMEKELGYNRAWLWLTAVVTFFVTLLASSLVIRYVISKPLHHLREVSNEVRDGNTRVRARIRTGDEFEQLAVAFNRMLRRLVKIQNDLRGAKDDLEEHIEELARANMQLYQLNAIKSDFLATMSHELRTPLNSIIGFSEVLGNISHLDDRQGRYVRNIQTSGRLLLDMINDILDMAKIEAGRMELRPTDFQIEPIISMQCDAARLAAEQQGIQLTCDVQSDIPPIHQDQSRIQQIVGNLLSNAVKFTPEGGKITVTARRDSEDRLVLQVADTGVGIAADEQTQVFEKFRQGSAALPDGTPMSREHSGTGLGLSIVRELCHLLGGDISLQSQLGVGSTFTVRLPWRLKPTPTIRRRIQELDAMTRPRLEFERRRRGTENSDLPNDDDNGNGQPVGKTDADYRND